MDHYKSNTLTKFSPLFKAVYDAGYNYRDISTTLNISFKSVPKYLRRPEVWMSINDIVLMSHLLGLSFTEMMCIVCRAKLAYTNREFYEMDDHISKGGK